MDKVLKKYTTIPAHLYVNRSADLQLRNIIEEMQRPGYVLVARQMGKTNLLLNAKRTLENSNRLFAYVDFSNLYENERECYRNIINNIIEPNIDKFDAVEELVEKIRSGNLPPHNEYSRSLRAILNHYKGDVVIVLDEIDALKSIDYSDNIFAQIRSNYFSRTSYPVFERLTYVLSGVIEPTELIRDKNKSPFNIGDKIYLDDFTYEEHATFIEKSKLPISNEVADEIFSWTNGNPRLTFDISSEIENLVIDRKTIDNLTIESIIKSKYLTSFDIAPIDHIRELVKTDSQVRNSVKLIHKKSSDQLSDDIKRRLYLYGIINSKFDDITTIKNKIIERSLSEEWIKSIEKDKEVSLVSGLLRFNNGDYEESVEIFENLISDSNISVNDRETATYFTALSYFKIENYSKALDFFDHQFSTKEFIDESQAIIGVCKIATGEKEKGISMLEEIVTLNKHDSSYHIALLNLALNTSNKDRSQELYEKLYDSTFLSKSEGIEELNRLKAISLYYQTNIYLDKKDIGTALEKIQLGIDNTKKSDSLYFLYLKYLLNAGDSIELIHSLVNTVINNELRFDDDKNNPVNFDLNKLLQYLNISFSELDLFEKLLSYSTNDLCRGTSNNELIFRASQSSIKNENEILNYLISLNVDDNLLKFKAYRRLTYLSDTRNKAFSSNFAHYYDLIRYCEIIESEDIYLFAAAIKIYSDTFKFEKALELCYTIDERLQNINDEDLKFESLIIYYWYTNLYFSKNDKSNAIKYAERTITLIDSSNRKKTSMIDEKGLGSIRDQLVQIKYSSVIYKPIVNEKKYGRNDKVRVRYIDGQEVEKKYKVLEPDILAERCKII